LRKVRAFYQVCDLKNYFRRLRLTRRKVLLKVGIAPISSCSNGANYRAILPSIAADFLLDA